MRKWSHIVFFILVPCLSFSQSLSSKGRFSIEFDRGCAPLTVNITSLDNFGDVTRLYSYIDPEVFTNDTTFTFTSVGVYEIIQVVGKDSIGDKTDTLILEVIEPQKPEIIVTKCSNLEVSITSIDSFYDSTRVFFSGSDSVTLLPNETYSYSFGSAGIQTIGLEGLFADATEVCPNYFEEIIPIPGLPPPNLVSASIKETCRDNYSLYITVDQIQENVNYRVILDQGSPATLYDDFLDSTSLVIHEIPFSLNDYCVMVQIYDPCNNNTISSNEICQTPSALSLSPFETLYSTYEGSSVYINLDAVASGTFEIERRFEGGEFESRASQVQSFSDPIGSKSRKYYYRINYRDACDEILYSAETNPPLVDAEEVSENSYLVNYISANNSLDSFNNALFQVGNQGSYASEIITSNSFNLNLSPENGVERQFLSIQSDYGAGLILNSNLLTLSYELVIYVPSAFTPNGDGLNDSLDFFGIPSENGSVKIYSRWGQTVFASNDLSIGWDGLISGDPAPSGTYLYEIVFETSNGKKLRQRGTFVLLEK